MDGAEEPSQYVLFGRGEREEPAVTLSIAKRPGANAISVAREVLRKVELAKVDVEKNKQLQAAFRIQSIPAVKAFKDGRLAAEFTGALPPAEVERFFDSLVPSEADELAASDREGDVVDRVHDALRPEAAHRKMLDEPLDLQHGPVAHAPGPGWKHATRWDGSISRSSGRTLPLKCLT